MDGLVPHRRGQTVSLHICFYSNYLFSIRLKLRAKIRHLRRSPANVDRDGIQSEREELSALFLQLKQFQQTAGVAEPNATVFNSSEVVDIWDDLAFDPVLTGAESTPINATLNISSADQPHGGRPNISNFSASQNAGQPTNRVAGPIPIEDQIIALPSNGNTSNVYRELELTHRIAMVEEQLNHIRDLIAEKSFQFSHVIRVSPRKGVTTRSRAAVKKLNNQIAEHCRLYARCRSCIVVLGADTSIISRFRVLSPADVSASTALLNPNQVGSTTIKLSWIWQTSSRHLFPFPDLQSDSPIISESAEDISSLNECMWFQF